MPLQRATKKLLSVGALVAAPAVFGLATNRIEVSDPKKYSYKQAEHKVLRVPLTDGVVIFASGEPFKEKDKVNSAGRPLNPDILRYAANVTLVGSQAKSIADKLASKGENGMWCPENFGTVPYTPSPNSTTPAPVSTEVKQPSNTKVQLRVCVEVGKIAVENDELKVPLMLAPRSDVPDQIINPGVRDDFCTDLANNYAGIVNTEAIGAAQSLGLPVTNETRLPIVVRMNSHSSNPCDMDAVIHSSTHVS
jgi:hypothetical protein